MFTKGDKAIVIDHSRYLPGDHVEILSDKIEGEYRCKRLEGSQLEYWVKEEQLKPIEEK